MEGDGIEPGLLVCRWWALNVARRSSVILNVAAVGVAAVLYTICLVATASGNGDG